MQTIKHLAIQGQHAGVRTRSKERADRSGPANAVLQRGIESGTTRLHDAVTLIVRISAINATNYFLSPDWQGRATRVRQCDAAPVNNLKRSDL